MTLAEPWAFLVKLLNFAVMLGILLKFAAKPFKDFLKNRADAVRQKVHEADRLLTVATSLKNTYEAKLAGLDAEMEAFRTTAIAEAEQEKGRIVAEARALADRIRQQARLAYDQEMKDAMTAVQAEIARKTLQAAEAAVRQLFSEADHEKMVDAFIEKLKVRP